MSDEQRPKQSPFTRKKLTPFLAHEMIYDYASRTLEPERRAALEEFLETDQESQALLKNIQNAQSYVTKLKALSIEPQILAHLLEAESALSLGRRYSSWREWPETLRWSITAITLSAVVAGSVALVPWSKLTAKKTQATDNVEVAQLAQSHPDDAEQVAANDEGSGDEPLDSAADEESSGDDVAETGDGTVDADDESDVADETSGDKVAGLAPAAVIIPTPAGTPPTPKAPPELLDRSAPSPFVAFFFPPAPKATPKLEANVEATLQPTPVATPMVAEARPTPKPTSTPTPAPGTNASAQVVMGETADTHDKRDAKAKGLVYRAFMTLSDLDEIGPKITADIAALGGEKAGDVELGWKRDAGRYYHFVLPESNEKKILERLQVYGPVRISKDPHPRVMPEGQVRFILWVESASQ